MCTRMCGDQLKTSLLSLHSGRHFRDAPPRPLHHLPAFRPGKEGVSVRSEWHTWNPSADVTVSELGETRAAGRVCGQGPSFRGSTGRSFSVHFSLLHLVSSTKNEIPSSAPQKANITPPLRLEYFLYLITSINYWIQKSSDMTAWTWCICFKAAITRALNGGERWTASSSGWI